MSGWTLMMLQVTLSSRHIAPNAGATKKMSLESRGGRWGPGGRGGREGRVRSSPQSCRLSRREAGGSREVRQLCGRTLTRAVNSRAPRDLESSDSRWLSSARRAEETGPLWGAFVRAFASVRKNLLRFDA